MFAPMYAGNTTADARTKLAEAQRKASPRLAGWLEVAKAIVDF